MTVRDLNYNHLHYFHVVATEGSLVEAARKLGVAPSTISQQLRLLEASLGSQLFVRDGSGLKLTSAGERAFEQTHVMFNAGSRLVRDVRPSLISQRLTLEVGACPSISRLFASRLLLPLFSDSDVIVRLRFAGIDELFHRVRSFELDFAISDSAPNGTRQKGIKRELIRKTPLIAVAAPSVAGRIEQFPRSLAEVPFIHLTSASPQRWLIDDYFRRVGVAPALAAEVDDVELIRELAASMPAWGIVPAIGTERWLESKRLEKLGDLDEETAIEISAYYIQREPTELVLRAIQSLKNSHQ